ncbi:MAG: CvpA family protein [Patescibacteria group bacterium]
MDFSLGANWIDLVFVVMFVYFVVTNSGLVRTSIEIGGFILSLLVSYYLYPFAAIVFIKNFNIMPGIANVLGFFGIWTLFEVIYFFITVKFLRTEGLINKKLDRNLGLFTGAVQAFIVFTLFISLIFALPVRGQVKQAVLDSKTGPFFISFSRSFESELKSVFGKAAEETLNFLTIKPDSTSSVDLGFSSKKQNLIVDQESEEIMVGFVNKEREGMGLSKLEIDTQLRSVSRDYAKQMLEYGFFSHVSAVDGSDAGDRVRSAGISYGILGENLAYAPDVYIAHQGLMNSPGHKKNILSPDYNKVGIGVIDAGIYGKMFVQLFSN